MSATIIVIVSPGIEIQLQTDPEQRADATDFLARRWNTPLEVLGAGGLIVGPASTARSRHCRRSRNLAMIVKSPFPLVLVHSLAPPLSRSRASRYSSS